MNEQSITSSNLCQHCARSASCFGCLDEQVAQTKQRSHKVYHRGDRLYIAGEEFHALYILRAGSAKSFFSSSNGDEQISGFFYPGDMMGADGFDSMKHAHNLTFLETSSVCRVSLQELDKVLIESPNKRRQLLKNMSHALVDEQHMLLNMSKLSSEQRLAKFLLDLSLRFQRQGLSAKTFDLSMTRIDLANFLGMAIETISRVLTKLQKQQVIQVNRRKITLLDIHKLQQSLCEDNQENLMSNKAKDFQLSGNTALVA